jgi:tetratricopeptide (TPR) repeat protein
MRNRKTLTLLFILAMTSCQKNFLDEKPNRSLLVPTTINDFQALLDNSNIMNSAPAGMAIIGADDFTTTADGLEQVEIPLEKNAYLWANDIYEGIAVTPDWDTPYQQIFHANIVLEGLEKLDAADGQVRLLNGSALFYRAFALYQLLQQFSMPYNPGTATSDLGVPVPLSANVNLRPGRGTVESTYQQIISDLRSATVNLPVTVAFPTRPNRAAAYALLARVYLTMQNYEQALAASDACLSLNDRLLDYNDLDPNSDVPFPAGIQNKNPEILFYSTSLYSFYFSPLTVVDPLLVNSYAADDLRRSVFLYPAGTGSGFKGSYTGDLFSFGLFAGLASDEIYLTRAEANARLGNRANALRDLNYLLSHRFRKTAFQPVQSTDDLILLSRILDERRKELVGRGARWSDLRRLNQDNRFAVTLKRSINGVEYTLPPNSPRYVFPIPDNEINASGIQQNPR